MSSGRVSYRAAAETAEQFEAALSNEKTELIYLDAGTFRPGELSDFSEKAHDWGRRIGLRMPCIFRKRARQYFEEHWKEIEAAGFDIFLIRDMESLFYLREKAPDMAMELDHSIYVMNSCSEDAISELCGTEAFDMCYPLELSGRELSSLGKRLISRTPERKRELVVYGRAPMMVSAQCVRSLREGCRKIPGTEYITDRTGRKLPVKNYCTFCYNVIYNPVPLYIADMDKELSLIPHDIRRFEFTVESGEEVRKVLGGDLGGQQDAYTRGWIRKGVL